MLANSGPVVFVLGPTCTGKSRLGLLLATKIAGEIVNADSMQVYRGFDIGTAKPTPGEQQAVPHHLIDVADPHQEFHAALFKKLADEAIRDISARGRVPVVVGGTGLYMRAILYDLFPAPTDMDLRASLRNEYAADPLGLYETLKTIDPPYALRISHRDGIRVVRAIEVFRLTGKSMSQWEEIHGFREARYRALKIGLRKERKELYGRIDERVDEMLRGGWLSEVEGLIEGGIRDDCKALAGIGYREILLYLRRLISYEDMVQRIKAETRRYAKRQFTWFSKEKDVAWYEYPEETEQIVRHVATFLSEWT